MHWRRGAVLATLMALGSAGLIACDGGNGQSSGDASRVMLAMPVDSLPLTLAGVHEYRVDTAALLRVGRITGSVEYDGTLPADTLVRPTHDLNICRPIPDAPFVGSADGVGDAVVWLTGVTHGAADTSPRRVQLSLEDCAIRPRVQRAPVGATLLVRSADAMNAQLRFLDAAPTTSAASSGASTTQPSSPDAVPRALVPMSDAGAVVPVSTVFERPGLVEVRDDRHPWVRGWIAVAPHPYVTITDARGEFTLDGVPPGDYVLVTWHERLGYAATRVVVDAGIDTRMRVLLPKR